VLNDFKAVSYLLANFSQLTMFQNGSNFKVEKPQPDKCYINFERSYKIHTFYAIPEKPVTDLFIITVIFETKHDNIF